MQRPSSLIKFMSEKSSNGRGKLHWARAGEDGAPFRGPQAPMMTEEEFDERLVRVGDPQIEIFDIGDPEQRALYKAVMDRIVNGWAQCQFVERQFAPATSSWIVYIEWVEYFMEDGMPMASHNPLAADSSGNGHG